VSQPQTLQEVHRLTFLPAPIGYNPNPGLLPGLNEETDMSIPAGFINLKQLKKRGWTDKLIEWYVPQPHGEAPNPINASWATQKLYHLATVKEIEADPRFQRRKSWANWFQGHMKECQREARERKAAQAAETHEAATA
jgi:hypothetical protein